jgi:KDO2-lipid IV(A) lauroyltransferase
MSALPLSWALGIGRSIAWLWYWVIRVRRTVAFENIERVMGDTMTRKEQRATIRRCMSMQAMIVIELLRAAHYTAEQSRRFVHATGMEHMDAAIAGGRGVIVVASHMGNVDLMGYSQSILGYPINVIVKEIKLAPVQRYIRAVRKRTGVGLLPSGKSKDQIRKVIADNKVMCMIVDQHMAKHRTIACEFFGLPAATSPAPARFALETGTPVLTALMVRRGYSGHFDFLIEPFEMEEPYETRAANVHHNTQRLNDIIEGWVRANPSQWLWFHKRWKFDDEREPAV